MRSVKIGEIYRIEDSDKYVQVEEPPEYEQQRPGMTYVCTRSLWPTSVFGQIETCGHIETEKLTPLRNTKADREIRKTINRVKRKGVDRSGTWYQVEKARKGKDGQHPAQEMQGL